MAEFLTQDEIDALLDIAEANENDNITNKTKELEKEQFFINVLKSIRKKQICLKSDNIKEDDLKLIDNMENYLLLKSENKKIRSILELSKILNQLNKEVYDLGFSLDEVLNFSKEYKIDVFGGNLLLDDSYEFIYSKDEIIKEILDRYKND